MHELSIAEALLGIISEHAGERRVTRVDVEVGHLRQVVPGALSFAFELLAKGTSAEGAELVLHEIPVRARCGGCGGETSQRGFPMLCGQCGQQDLQIVSGEELRLESLEVEQPVLQEVR